MLCDVKTSHVMRAMRYARKGDRPQVGVAEHVVMRLMEPYHKTGKNVTTDNYFTTLKTAKNLLQHNITMVGILRKNKKEIPAEPAIYDNVHTTAASVCITIPFHAEGCYHDSLLQGQTEKRCISML